MASPGMPYTAPGNRIKKKRRKQMTDDTPQLAVIKGQLDLILWRLTAIEEQREDDTKWRRQVWTAIMVAILTAILGVVLPLLSVR